MKYQKGNIVIGMFVVMWVLLIAISWVTNLVKLADCDFESPYKCEVMHGIGIIPIAAPFVVWICTDEQS